VRSRAGWDRDDAFNQLVVPSLGTVHGRWRDPPVANNSLNFKCAPSSGWRMGSGCRFSELFSLGQSKGERPFLDPRHYVESHIFAGRGRGHGPTRFKAPVQGAQGLGGIVSVGIVGKKKPPK